MKELFYLPVSPWSERTVFGLAVAGALDDIKLVEYTPFVSEPFLRWKMGRLSPSQTVTVPVLFLEDGKTFIEGSVNILKHCSNDSALLPLPKDEEKLERIIKLTETALNNSRYRYTFKVSTEGGKMDADKMAFPLNKLLIYFPASVEKFMSKTFTSLLLKKYGGDIQTPQEALENMRKALLELQAMLGESEDGYVCDNRLTVADIVLSSAVPFVPLPKGYCNVGPNMQAAWREPELEPELQKLITWRDKLYVKHRGNAMTVAH